MGMDLSFTGEVIYWRGPSPFYFAKIPPAQSEIIKIVSKELTYGWGVIPVVAISKKVEWETALFPKEGLYLLPVKNVVRAALSVEPGDLIMVKMKLGRQ